MTSNDTEMMLEVSQPSYASLAPRPSFAVRLINMLDQKVMNFDLFKLRNRLIID